LLSVVLFTFPTCSIQSMLLKEHFMNMKLEKLIILQWKKQWL